MRTRDAELIKGGVNVMVKVFGCRMLLNGRNNCRDTQPDTGQRVDRPAHRACRHTDAGGDCGPGCFGADRRTNADRRAGRQSP